MKPTWDDVRERFAGVIGTQLYKSITSNPNRELSEVGFWWASAIALKQFWPNLSFDEAAKWMLDYIEVKPCTDGYTWTFAAAQDIAREYVDQFGE